MSATLGAPAGTAAPDGKALRAQANSAGPSTG